MAVSEYVYYSISGNRFACAVHPPLHKLQPEPTGGGAGAEAQSEDWNDSGGSAAENLQGPLSGGSVCRHASVRDYTVEYFCLLMWFFEEWVAFVTDYPVGHAGIFPLHPGCGSDFAALPRPLCGTFWWTHVQTLIRCV